MNKIEDIDKNLKIKTNIDKNDIRFYNALNAPCKIYGLFYEDGKYRRMPETAAKTVSDGVYRLHAHTSGGRVRFKTDSPYVAISVKMGDVAKLGGFALTGSAGFDLYINESGTEKFVGAFIPPFDIKDGYESVLELETDDEPDNVNIIPPVNDNAHGIKTSKMREMTINFPLYSEVRELYIGISDSAVISTPDDYEIEKPIVYYGSSITQGGCVSRPGNICQNIISRRFKCNYINLGFAGNAKAEMEIADYIKKLDMSLFVYDYDYNAPTAEYLANTHERMFKTIRKEQPDLPIIMMSMPKFRLKNWERERLEIIETTYNNAIANGDKNVWLIKGPELMSIAKYDGTVDTAHPNAYGAASIAKILGDVIEKNNCIKF